MKTGGYKDRCIGICLIIITLMSIIFTSKCIFWDGIFYWHITQPEFWEMIAELVILFCLYAAILRFAPSFKIRLMGTVAVTAVFLWIHVVFLPVVCAAVYTVFICALGNRLRLLTGSSGKGSLLRDFLLGSGALILLFCILSAVGIGSIPDLLDAVIILVFILIISYVVGHHFMVHKESERQIVPDHKEDKKNWVFALSVAFVLTMLALQAGRMNIAIDFDSLWYGLRGPYILDNGGGIYEDLGTVGVSYTYSKGFEILLLPLSILPSYSFQLAFTFVLTAMALYAIYRVAGLILSGKTAWFLTVLLSSIPGIMNMAISAKTDIITLLLQLIMIEELLRCLKGEREAFLYGTAAFLLSWTMKPTALLFSSAVYGMGVIALIICHFMKSGRDDEEQSGPEDRRSAGNFTFLSGILSIVISTGALIGVWARTMILTGLPVTSVFTSIFTKLGFTLKYPYLGQEFPNSAAYTTLGGWIKLFIKRLYGVLLNPSGDDLSHVIVAWGSLLPWLCILIWFLSRFASRRKLASDQKKSGLWLWIVFIPFLLGNLLSLAMLYQVDGNYFMLLYVLCGLIAFFAFDRLKDRSLRRAVEISAVCVMVFSGIFCAVSNWSWTLGFTPVSLINRGYYDHEEAQHEEMIDKGNAEIWDILASDPENRVIAIGDHPDVLAFPCNVESYIDVTGSWGNIWLVSSVDAFVEFLDYAKTDYIYVQREYLTTRSRAYELTCSLLEYGILTPVCYEEGNLLARVDLDGQYSPVSVQNMEEFIRDYPLYSE